MLPDQHNLSFSFSLHPEPQNLVASLLLLHGAGGLTAPGILLPAKSLEGGGQGPNTRLWCQTVVPRSAPVLLATN